MSHNVSGTRPVDHSYEINHSPKTSESVPKGIDCQSSSISSMEDGQVKTISQRIKECFNNILNSINNFFLSIFYRMVYCQTLPTFQEKRYSEFQEKLNAADEFSKELVFREAELYPVVYTHLGEEVFAKSKNIIWKIFFLIQMKRDKTTYKEIGEKEAIKNYKALIFHLKAYYTEESSKLENKIRREQSLD